MNAHEQQLVVSVDARPSGQLAERTWVRTGYRACTSHPWSIRESSESAAVDSLGTSSHDQLLARAGVHLNSTCPASIAPIQYP